jgi:hypothetical protein
MAKVLGCAVGAAGAGTVGAGAVGGATSIAGWFAFPISNNTISKTTAATITKNMKRLLRIVILFPPSADEAPPLLKKVFKT